MATTIGLTELVIVATNNKDGNGDSHKWLFYRENSLYTIKNLSHPFYAIKI